MHHFTKQTQLHVHELGVDATVLTHNTTHATVVKLVSDNPSKTFLIGFKTPQTSSKGVAHVVEHAVLCGSDRFTTKNPFNDMKRTSLQTYLNASTYVDGTCFPLSTQNRVDYFNLMRVYTDAVFCSRLLHDSIPFHQEGVRWDVEDETHPVVTGIVLNEVKQLESNVMRIIDHALKHALYNGSYSHAHGGYSRCVETLTHEEAVQFHKTHYHPSNSITVLCSPAEMLEDELVILDEYFSCAEEKPRSRADDSGVPAPHDHVLEVEYPVDKEEEQKDVFVCAWRLPQLTQEEKSALSVVADVLFDAKGSIFSRLITEKRVGKKTSSSLGGQKWPIFMVVVRDATRDAFDVFKTLLDEELARVVKDGLDASRVEASCNKMEFDKADACLHSTRGMRLAREIFGAFRRDEDVLQPLCEGRTLQDVHRNVPHGILENIVRRLLVENAARVFVRAKPKADLLREWDAEDSKRHCERVSMMSVMEKEQWMHVKKALMKEHEQEDTIEQKATIPKLRLSDVGMSTPDFSLRRIDASHEMYVKTAVTNGIVFVRMFFDVTDFSLYDLLCVSLLCSLLRDLDTATHSYVALNTLVDTHFGSLAFQFTTYQHSSLDSTFCEVGHARFFFTICFSALSQHVQQCLTIIKEIVETAQFTEKNIRRRLAEVVTALDARIRRSPEDVLREEVMARLNAPDNFFHPIVLHNKLRLVKDIMNAPPDCFDVIVKDLQSVCLRVFSRTPSTFFCCSDDLTHDVSSLLSTFKLHVPNVSACPEEHTPTTPLKDRFGSLFYNPEGFVPVRGRRVAVVMPIQTSFVGVGCNMLQAGHAFTAARRFLARHMQRTYLRDAARIKNGAYGCFVVDSIVGPFFTKTHRDPALLETLATNERIPAFLRAFGMEREAFEEALIGVLAPFDAPQGVEALFDTSVSRMMRNSTENHSRLRNAVVELSLDAVVQEAKAIADVWKERLVVVVTNNQLAQEHKGLFDELVPVL